MQQTILGIDRETESQVTIETELRQRSMYVVGIQGGGKSSFLQTLIHQDIVAGSSVIVIDPHEDLLYDVIAQLPENKLDKTFLLDLSDRAFPFGLNIFSCVNHRDDEQRDITRNRVAHMFERIWPETIGGRYFGTLLENVIDTLIENPGATMADIPLLLQDETRRSQFISHLQNREVQNYWTQDYNKKSVSVQQKERDPLVSRVRELLRQTTIKNIICQKSTTFDFRTAIENNEIILINLPLRAPAYEKSAPIMGIMLLSEICRAVFSFANIRDIAKRPRFSLYVDEYQNFTTSDFSRLFTEGRKFGIRTTVAHQERSQLDDTNRNASTTAFTKVAFQTTAKDAAELADYFRAKDTWIKPKNVYTDVLPHLKDHPNSDVAAFFDTYIAPLQAVSKEKVRHYRDEGDVYPELTILDKTFSIDPEIVMELLEGFRKSLYAVSCGQEFEWPNYYQIVKWWDFRLASKKTYESAPPIQEVTLGWQMDCREVPFDKDASFVAALRKFGNIATWKPVDATPGMYLAQVDETLGKKWSEMVEITWLLARMGEEENAFRMAVLNRHKQNDPTTFLEMYHAGKLTLAFLQSVVPLNGPPPPKEQIERIGTQRRAQSERYKVPVILICNCCAYLTYLQEVYKAKVGHLLPLLSSPPNIDLTSHFLWFTYQRKATLSEIQTLKKYIDDIQTIYTFTSSAPDQPPTIRAPVPAWKKALEGDMTSMLSLLIRYTEPSYFLYLGTEKKIDLDAFKKLEKLLTDFCTRWYAYTHDLISWVKKDVQATYAEACTDTRKLKEQLDAQRQEIVARIAQRFAEEEKRRTQFRTLFLATANELQNHPLGELKTPSNAEVKETILSLKPRQAYVRIGTAVHTIETLTVPDKVGENKLARRVSSIREHTHQTYCQKRSVVESAFSQDSQKEKEISEVPPEKTTKQKRVFMPYEEIDEE